MTDKNTAALIIVALIGAIGVILAACIGLIPTILPMVRPTFTPNVLFSATFTPSNTPLPETPSATSAPTDIPTSKATLQPLETPTDTPTTVPTLAASSSNIDDYVGIWINVDSEPASDRVKLVITRVDVSKTGDTTANLVVCQHTQDGAIAVLPNPAPGLLYDFALVARDLSIPSEPISNGLSSCSNQENGWSRRSWSSMGTIFCRTPIRSGWRSQISSARSLCSLARHRRHRPLNA